ncbi:MAG: DUF4347 domain-containing protein, partial [Gammaproteobacteria bacterium]|nr:DUF4347 domain-containing protein [Gammaproteobacteria bacterium]
MKKKIFKKPPIIEAMEPRVLFSDGLEGVLAQELSVETTTAVSTATLEQLLTESPETSESQAAEESRQEIIFVDTDTPDYQVLVDDLLANQDATRHFEVVLLNNQRDGVTQVSEALSMFEDVDAVHIISHGDDGSIELGDSVLDFEALKANVDAIQSWGDTLTAEGDILIYGCNLAATSAGEALVDGLAKLTGADVAASDDLTGSTEQGGDWELEYTSGAIETDIALSAQAQADFDGVLNSAPVLSGANDLTSIDEDPVSNPGTLVSDLIAGQVTDVDAGDPTGIAVIGVDDTNGSWEYTTDSGSNWYAFGAADATTARLLAADASTSVRFVPDPEWNGTVTNGITFHAWDQTSGTAGGTADLSSPETVFDQFSSVSYSNNDGTASWTGNWIESGDDGSASSGDLRIEGGELFLFTSVSITRPFDLSSASSGTLTFDYSGYAYSGTDNFAISVSDDNGDTWVELEEVSFVASPGENFSGSRSFDLESYVSLTADMVVRFGITSGFAGPGQHVNFDNVQIEYGAGGGTGGTTAFSTDSASSSITVNAVNDAPVLDASEANLWLSTTNDMTGSAAPGLANWTDGEILDFG